MQEGMVWEWYITEHNAHRLYQILKKEEIEHVKPDEDRPSQCDKVTINMVSPAQTTVERTESEAKHLKANSQKRKSQSLDSAQGVHYSDKSKKKKTGASYWNQR